MKKDGMQRAGYAEGGKRMEFLAKDNNNRCLKLKHINVFICMSFM